MAEATNLEPLDLRGQDSQNPGWTRTLELVEALIFDLEVMLTELEKERSPRSVGIRKILARARSIRDQALRNREDEKGWKTWFNRALYIAAALGKAYFKVFEYDGQWMGKGRWYESGHGDRVAAPLLGEFPGGVGRSSSRLACLPLAR